MMRNTLALLVTQDAQAFYRCSPPLKRTIFRQIFNLYSDIVPFKRKSKLFTVAKANNTNLAPIRPDRQSKVASIASTNLICRRMNTFLKVPVCTPPFGDGT